MKLIYYRHNQMKKTAALPPVTTYYTDLTLLLHGELEYVVNGTNVTLQSGDILFCGEGVTLSRKSSQNADFVSFNFCPTEGDAVYDFPLHIKNGITKSIKHLLAACDEISVTTEELDPPFSLIVPCILMQLSKNLQQKRFHPLTVEIIRYVGLHLNEPITLAHIANATFFSPSYCSLVFRKDMHSSIIDYALTEKIKEAKRLIEEGLPLKQIAEILAFSDYNYFSRIFKNRVGCSPILYKKEQLYLPNLHFGVPYKQPITARYFADSLSQLSEAETNSPHD